MRCVRICTLTHQVAILTAFLRTQRPERRMQRLKHIFPIAALSLACVGCGDGTATPTGATSTRAAPTSPPTSINEINDTDPSIIYSNGNSSIQDWHYFQSSKEDFQQDEHSSN